ncbi:MAG: hypothetical protein MUF11_11960 [Beijerinckiaceae bacterium]|jgi:hypothetical protein|nr:hypothetical protein [Beijerinckiaceae bacterium]
MRWSRSLSAKVAAGALALLGAAPALAAPLARISTVVEAGVAPGAGLVRQGLPRYLAAELARAGADGFPAGTRLELVIREIYLSHDGGMPFGVTNDFSPMPDAITGVTRLIDARGNVLLERRAFATSAPDAGGFGPDNAARRVDALMRSLAYWVARDIAR